MQEQLAILKEDVDKTKAEVNGKVKELEAVEQEKKEE